MELGPAINPTKERLFLSTAIIRVKIINSVHDCSYASLKQTESLLFALMYPEQPLWNATEDHSRLCSGPYKGLLISVIHLHSHSAVVRVLPTLLTQPHLLLYIVYF